MKSRLSYIGQVLAIVGILGSLAIGVREAYAATRMNAGLVCQFCTSTPQCNTCCINQGSDGGVCTMAGVCLCT